MCVCLCVLVQNLARFCEADFLPTEEDSVMARIRTTGIVNSELEQKVDKKDELEPSTIKFQVVDVGGQRNERKKCQFTRARARETLRPLAMRWTHQRA